VVKGKEINSALAEEKDVFFSEEEDVFSSRRKGTLYSKIGYFSLMKKIINSSSAPSPVGPYNQSVLSGNTLYLSGQIAIDPSTGNLVTDNIEDETHQVFKNLSNVLKEAGMNFENIVKCSVFVSDMNMYSRINAVYSQYFD